MSIGTPCRTDMQKVNAILCSLFLFAGAGCVTVDSRGDDWLGQDKVYHFAGSGILGAAGAGLGHEAGLSDVSAGACSFGLVMAMGAGKEAYDARVKKTYWSWKDLAWDAAGGILGNLIYLGLR